MSLFLPRKCYMGCVFLQIRMSYYAPFPAFYPYPVDYYPLYGPDQMDPNSQMFYAPPPGPVPNGGLNFRQHKPGYNNRKESNDSGISDASSRKVSR